MAEINKDLDKVDSESLRFLLVQEEDATTSATTSRQGSDNMISNNKKKCNNCLHLWMFLWTGVAPFGFVLTLSFPAAFSPNDEPRIKFIVAYTLMVSHVAVYLAYSYGKYTRYCTGYNNNTDDIVIMDEKQQQVDHEQPLPPARRSIRYFMTQTVKELGILVMFSMASAVWDMITAVPNLDPVAATLYQFFHLYMTLLIVPVIFTSRQMTFHVVWLKSFNLEIPTRNEILLFTLVLFGYLFLFRFLPLLPLAWSFQPMWMLPVSLVVISTGMRIVARCLLFSVVRTTTATTPTPGGATPDTWIRFWLEFRWWTGPLIRHHPTTGIVMTGNSSNSHLDLPEV